MAWLQIFYRLPFMIALPLLPFYRSWTSVPAIIALRPNAPHFIILHCLTLVITGVLLVKGRMLVFNAG
jgi:hypothetical protein